MSDALGQLLRVSSPSLAPWTPAAAARMLRGLGRVGDELFDLLERRNGFYAFESALHVLPVGQIPGQMDLERWNSPQLWRRDYGELAVGHLFFAEDALGDQYSLRGDGIAWFDAETGAIEEFAISLDEWASKIIATPGECTAWPLAHVWQERHGALTPGERLVPKIPFVMGGRYDLDNLYSLDAVEAMRFRAHIARQIKDLPDGSRIELKVVD